MKSAQYLLQKVGPSSAIRLAEFLTTSFIEAYSDVHSAENIKSYCSRYYNVEQQEKVIADPSYDIFFALKDHREVGVLVIHHHECHLRPELKASELKQLYLKASEYGTGLGKWMIENAFVVISQHRNDWIWLCVSDLNRRAKRFYEKSDFKRIGKGPILQVGTEELLSSILLRKLN